MQQAVLNNLKLQLSHGTDNLPAIELIGKQLGYTLVHQLLDTFVQLLCLHRIGVLYIFEHLGREAWQSLEMQFLSGSQRIPYLKVPGIRQTDNITRKRLIHHFFLLSHESRRTTETHHLTEAYMLIVRVTLKTTGTNLHKSDTTAMVRVHIRMDLENEAGEIILIRVYHTLYRMDRTWRGSDTDKAIQ